MSVWSKKEAEARALEMDSYYMKTGFEGYAHERDKWTEIAKRADNTGDVKHKAETYECDIDEYQISLDEN